jgi:hypothetical protein
MKRWLGIAPQSGTAPKRDFEDLASAALEAFGDAQTAHISDLRVLIDKAHEREAQLAKMVQMVMEDRFYRPVVAGKPSENRTTAAMPVEHLSDVAQFDEKEDAEQMRKQEELESELMAIRDEQNSEGINKVSV